MKKALITTCALLLLGLLAFSAAKSVSAIRVGSAVFCPNAYYDPQILSMRFSSLMRIATR
jgi:hypothetical protein